MKLPFFKNKNPTQVTVVKMIAEQGSYFYAWNKNLYDSDIIRSCIRPYAKAVGKLVPKHILTTSNDIKTNPEPYMRILLKDPNPYMSNQMLQEKLATQLKLNNNAFAYINRDINGYPTEIYPINCISAKLKIVNNNVEIEFTLINGKHVQFSYSDLIHLRSDFNNDEIFGTPLGETLTPLMEVVTTTDQGIIKAIKNSSIIRWLLKFSANIKGDDIQKETKKFADAFLSTESEGTGVAGVNSTTEAKQIEPYEYVPNALQMDRTTNRIYNLFGTNEKIIQNKYTEDEWNSYYEGEIETFAIQYANECTKKLFTINKRAYGNEIIMECSNLQYASMSTKLALLQMVDRGAMTPNEWRKILNLGPIEGGNNVVRRLDTAVVNQVKLLIDKLTNENHVEIGNMITKLLEGGM